MRLLLVDDHAFVRDAMLRLVRDVVPDVVASHAAALKSALLQLDSAPPFDLVLFDLTLPGSAEESGLPALRALLRHAGPATVVVMSGEERPEVVRECLDAGAHSFILKASEVGVIKAALQLVLSGGRYVPPLALAVKPSARTVDDRLSGLTPRQLDVLARLVEGLQNKAIARELGITDATVKTHVTAIMRYLGTSTRAQTVRAMRDVALPIH